MLQKLIRIDTHKDAQGTIYIVLKYSIDELKAGKHSFIQVVNIFTSFKLVQPKIEFKNWIQCELSRKIEIIISFHKRWRINIMAIIDINLKK